MDVKYFANPSQAVRKLVLGEHDFMVLLRYSSLDHKCLDIRSRNSHAKNHQLVECQKLLDRARVTKGPIDINYVEYDFDRMCIMC